MATLDALWPLGDLRRQLALANHACGLLEHELGKIVSGGFDRAKAAEVSEQLGRHLVAAGGELGRIEACLARTVGIRGT